MDYKEFIKSKEQADQNSGFEPLWMPDFLFPFQKHIVEWAIRKGRAAIFASPGLGKTPCQLCWAQNVVQKTNGRVLVLAPLAVSHQTIREAHKFGMEATRTKGEVFPGINVTNYERLKEFKPEDFVGVVADESGILKSFDGKTRQLITEFMRTIPYRLLCTATPAPNDFMELGTSSQALGNMSYNNMLAMFFCHHGDTTSQWTLKDHAKKRFWQWVSTWAMAIRKPSDLGYDDADFELKPLRVKHSIVKSESTGGMFWAEPANTLNEQRQERRDTIEERCNIVSSLDPGDRQFICWCHLNVEGDLLEKVVKDAVQVSGGDDDDVKEDRLMAFVDGKVRVLVSKSKICGYGLNLQCCSDVSYFPDHSYEAFFQSIRRCWRFGQKREVNCHIVSSERESKVVDNMMRKEKLAEEMYDGIIREMSEFQLGTAMKMNQYTERMRKPSWLA